MKNHGLSDAEMAAKIVQKIIVLIFVAIMVVVGLVWFFTNGIAGLLAAAFLIWIFILLAS